MHNLKTNFDKILSIIEDCYPDFEIKCSMVGRPAKFSDKKVIALSLTAESLGIDSENYLFSKLRSDYAPDFPDLITRSNFNIRIRQLKSTVEAIRKVMLDKLASKETIFSIDSMPIEICRLARSNRIKICKENQEALPAKGYCAAQKQYYYGYKLHALVGMNGAIQMYDLSAANVHDINYLQDVRTEINNCSIIGDKAYDSSPLQLALFEENHINLLSPRRQNSKNYKPFPHYLKLIRKRVETTFSQLCDQFNIRRNYAKSFAGLTSRIIRKLTAFTVLQYINTFITNRPQNQIKHALA